MLTDATSFGSLAVRGIIFRRESQALFSLYGFVHCAGHFSSAKVALPHFGYINRRTEEVLSFCCFVDNCKHGSSLSNIHSDGCPLSLYLILHKLLQTSLTSVCRCHGTHKVLAGSGSIFRHCVRNGKQVPSILKAITPFLVHSGWICRTGLGDGESKRN